MIIGVIPKGVSKCGAGICETYLVPDSHSLIAEFGFIGDFVPGNREQGTGMAAAAYIPGVYEL